MYDSGDSSQQSRQALQLPQADRQQSFLQFGQVKCISSMILRSFVLVEDKTVKAIYGCVTSMVVPIWHAGQEVPVFVRVVFSYSATEKSTSCRSPRMDFLPPLGGVSRLSHLGVIAGYPMQTVMLFSRCNGQNGNKKAVTEQTSSAFAFSGRSC